jgi:nucleoside 2-deoxyribosyltransferase
MNQAKIYLSYAMQFVKDEQVQKNRATSLTEKLEALGYEIYNPYDRTSDVFEMCQIKDRDEFNSLQSSDFNRYIHVMRAIKNNDINGVKSCDIIIAFLDPGVSGGQAGELTIAEYVGKKVLGIMSQANRDKISSWVLSCCDRVFASESEVIQFLTDDTRPINIWGSQP